ncbi:hypothetical protein [Phenylobacterium soli]|uniref:hypothetical protein n=1 Tax=Phenylobacterium soli TaxID=2170551 RepID=UPI0036118172
MTEPDESKPEDRAAAPQNPPSANPYARPSAYPPMQGARMMLAGGRYPSRAQSEAGAPRPAALTQPGPSPAASILSGSALPIGRPSGPPAEAVEPAPTPPPQPAEPTPHTVAPLEIHAPLGAQLGSQGVLARTSASGGRKSWLPAAAAIVVAVAGLGVLLYVTRPAQRPSLPPAAPALTAPPAPQAQAPAPAPTVTEPTLAPSQAAASAPAPAARPAAPVRRAAVTPKRAPATAAVQPAAPEPAPMLAVPPPAPTPAPAAAVPAGPAPTPAKPPPSDPNAPIGSHAPDAS